LRPETPENPHRRGFLAALALAVVVPLAPRARAADDPLPATPAWPLLSSLKGKVVLVDFWASWCSPCLRSFPWMNELHRRHAGEGLVVVAVNVDQDRALADAFLNSTPAAFRIEFDAAGSLAKRFGVQAMPTSFLIDRRGALRVRHAGFRDAQREERERQIRELLQERA
jgi:thiol-disulfide isomerase/thioredoxin